MSKIKLTFKNYKGIYTRINNSEIILIKFNSKLSIEYHLIRFFIKKINY